MVVNDFVLFRILEVKLLSSKIFEIDSMPKFDMIVNAKLIRINGKIAPKDLNVLTVCHYRGVVFNKIVMGILNWHSSGQIVDVDQFRMRKLSDEEKIFLNTVTCN